MTIYPLFERIFLRYAALPALCYCALVVLLLGSAAFAVSDIVERHRKILEATETLGRFEHPKSKPTENGQVVGDEPRGSPFLEGQSETTASAALLERLTSAITHVGGSVISSEVGAEDKQSSDGFVRVTATSELEQKALQPLLYDIEAGMPFLFVNKLIAQGPLSAGDNGRMRVVLEVSGLWPGAKAK